MAEQLLIRNLPDGTKAQLLEHARRCGRKRSAESEARELLRETLGDALASPVEQFLAIASRFRQEFGGIEMPSIDYHDYELRSVGEPRIDSAAVSAS